MPDLARFLLILTVDAHNPDEAQHIGQAVAQACGWPLQGVYQAHWLAGKDQAMTDEPMIDVAAHADEWYPVWTLSAARKDLDYARRNEDDFGYANAALQVPASLLERWRRVSAEFHQIQHEIVDLAGARRQQVQDAAQTDEHAGDPGSTWIQRL